MTWAKGLRHYNQQLLKCPTCYYGSKTDLELHWYSLKRREDMKEINIFCSSTSLIFE